MSSVGAILVHIKLHQGQLQVLKDTHRFRTMVCGRRFGKSRLMTWELLLAALKFPGKVDPVSPAVVLGTLPTLVQAKKILWKPLVALAETELKPFVAKIDRTDYRIDFKGGKPSITIAGANDSNGDRLRGLKLWFYGGDEIQDVRQETWEAVILPAMSDTPGSRALLTGTPKGKGNFLYKLYQMPTVLPDQYASFNMPSWVNPVIPRDEIESAKLRLPPRLFRQEYEASFEDFPGKYFTELNELNRADLRVPDYYMMGIDWGDVNPAVVVLGVLGRTYYYITGWQPQGLQPVPEPELDYWVLTLARKYDIRCCLADPSRPSSILRMRSMGKDHGIQGLVRTVAGYNRIAEGVNQVHSLIYQRRLLFPFRDTSEFPNEVTPETAYQLHQDYHRAINKDGQVLDEPAPGQNDHIVDATRYLCSVKNP